VVRLGDKGRELDFELVIFVDKAGGCGGGGAGGGCGSCFFCCS
jgi:hypothetical protein